MIRVLHVFGPKFGLTFSGDSKLWVRLFQKWANELISHQILFVEQGVIVGARSIKDAFGSRHQISSMVFPRWRRFLWAIKLLWLLTFKKHYYDIIHVHTDYWGALLVGPLSKILGRPCIFHIVRMGEDDPTTIVMESFGAIKLWCIKRYDSVVCISEALRQECLRQGFGEDKVLLLVNAVDTDLFSPYRDGLRKYSIRERLSIPKHAVIVLSVGSIIARKRTKQIFEAFLSLVKNYPDLYLVLVGPASREESSSVDNEYVEEMRKVIKETGFSDHVVFTGRIDDDSILAEYYRMADIFAFPTYQEGLPNVLLEAMSTGLPVVATRLPGSTDLIVRDGETGFLIPQDDVSELKGKLGLVLGDQSLKKEMGIAARVRIIQNFSFETWQKKMAYLYFSLAGKILPEDSSH
jgi:glycosyltransferase involved in cell wall biosynthesis